MGDQMKQGRILVIGCPGSGKSNFARRLAAVLDIALVHLDMLYWNADQTTVSREVFIARLREAMKADCWILDGNYASSLEMRLECCDRVFFLDYPVEICLEGIRERMGKPRDDLPWIETGYDAEFLSLVREFPEKTRPQILEWMRRYPEKQWIVFSNREEAEQYLRKFE